MPTEHKTNTLVTNSQNLLPFIESLPDAVVIVNTDHEIALVNSQAEEMFGHPAETLKGSDLMMIIPELHRSTHKQNVDYYFQKPVYRPMGAQKRFSGVRADGTEVPVDIMINIIMLDGVKVAMALVRDVTYQRELEDRLILDSLTDEMTGFYNRKHFKARLAAQQSDFVRSGVPTSVIMLDFDHFKSINDHYGHAAGDILLINAAKMIQKELRPLDVGCRIGGEEFAIILPNTHLDNAVRFAKRIRQLIEQMAFKWDDTTLHATVTIGVASFAPTDTSFDSLMTRADEALYVGKVTGRNCVVSQDALSSKLRT
ncbi:sensor domain-containing diguanylate cyclase [Marinobacter alexandrii]|uniref:sensor domain-containing diguanylate cyclase n=1 Tax=Marinobacter TaxID=2742 RepID=UPI001FFFAE0D|nr:MULTISPECIES: sensor domain-containing diguanylate cyclase [Marinobacter]MCK2151291.1 sensor domain-containing diguanylate cyclase [Marinobacter alexandrii]